MTGFLGADPEQLIAQGQAMERHGTRLQALGEELSTAARSVSWTGPDADSLREEISARVATALSDESIRLENCGRALYRHAAQQDAASSVDGRGDSARYAELLGGESWSDIIDTAQDAWAATPFDDPLTLEELGGRYTDSPEGKDFDPADVDLSPEAIADQRMRQGSLGDCWLLAALMAAAQSDPQFLADNITLREDGTWDVTLYEDGEPVVVTVEPDQIARDGARAEVRGAGEEEDGGNTWENDEIGYMSIYEQAAINHLGPDYESVIADTPSAGLELITGADADGSDILSWNGQPSMEQLETALSQKRPITVMTDPIMPFNRDLSSAHVYQVTGVDRESGEVILSNPWGDGSDMPGEVRVPLNFFYDNSIVMTGVGARPEDFGKGPS
ncbi:hypothetical protein CFK41_00975 [Brachybacterium ginsengisoli]|uniref:Calpain catalytic domain-containing protein n=1 Tax=Brachybacterium ginsengisoli TaxID=1331682 RepID=A0A291GTS9_9MICO|nr:C2 family cysteine protease [Brachybacterium ginsengisoli]ATG53504.1 hypothetical protein CFK41_00975 [Brachybacterium ginsengisoli]